MSRPSGERGAPRLKAGVLLALVPIILLVALPLAGAITPASAPSTPVRPGASITGTVVFNGVATASHSTQGSAISASFDSPFSATFNWTVASGSATITAARLIMIYFGAAIATKEVDIQNALPGQSGSIPMSMDLTQNRYLIEGLYSVHAELVGNGSTVWEETFYVHITASNHITVVNIALILLGIYEIYQIAMLGSVKAAGLALSQGTGQKPKEGK